MGVINQFIPDTKLLSMLEHMIEQDLIDR